MKSRPDIVTNVSMSQGITISKRDSAILSFLDLTPATAAQIRKVSATYGEDFFRDERRVRERLQALGDAGLVKSYSLAVAGGGLMSYYRLTPEGYRAAFPDKSESPPRTNFAEVAPSRVRHAIATADAIAHTMTASHNAGVEILSSHGDGRLVLEIGEYRQVPDFHFQLSKAGKVFNLVFEIDNATEPIDSMREQSIRTKILGYEMYQNWVLSLWSQSGRCGPRPSFRVIFLTIGVERANHILWFANERANNLDRRLIYATTQDNYLSEERAVTQPIFNDHLGHWQSLVNHQPTSAFVRERVRFARPIARTGIL